MNRGLRPVRDRADPTTWTLARHEAGHAVAAIVLGIEFNLVTLRPADPAHDGAVIATAMPTGRPLAIATMLLAGVAAIPTRGDDLTVADAAELFDTVGAIDLAMIRRHADGLSQSALARLMFTAFDLVHRIHGDAVDAVAQALLNHPQQQLLEREVQAIVDDHQPGGISHLIRELEDELRVLQP